MNGRNDEYPMSNSTLQRTESDQYDSFGDNYAQLEYTRKVPSQNYSGGYVPRNAKQETAIPMRLWDWFITFLIIGIPIFGVVMLFIWSFDENINPNKKNFARAQLIFLVIVMTSSGGFWRVFFTILFAMFNPDANASLF